MGAVKLFQTFLQTSLSHRPLHHIYTFQVKVVHRVKAGDAIRTGLGQSQELLSGGGNGLSGRIVSERESQRIQFDGFYYY